MKRAEARIRKARRANQDKHLRRSAFKSRWRDRYNQGTAAAMAAIYQGKTHATEAMRASVTKTVESIRADDPELATRLFGEKP